MRALQDLNYYARCPGCQFGNTDSNYFNGKYSLVKAGLILNLTRQTLSHVTENVNNSSGEQMFK
jgi:hypothetical protein